PHDDHVAIATSSIVVLPQGPLDPVPDLFVGAPPSRVVLVDVEPDPVQVEALETVPGHERRRLGTVAPIPLRLIADQDPESGMPVLQVERMKSRVADQAVVLPEGDSKHHAALLLGGAGDELLLLVAIHRAVEDEVSRNFLVVD